MVQPSSGLRWPLLAAAPMGCGALQVSPPSLETATFSCAGAALGLISWPWKSANTRNTGYANAVAALEEGVVSLDASVGGAGGCPFAPDATGNIATEDLVYLLRGLGVETRIDLDALIATSRWLGERLGKELPGMLARAGDYPYKS